MSLVGNRPQFVKAAPLSRALRARGTEILIHSGQHYDPELADLFFDELDIPTPDHALGVGQGTQLGQLAAMLIGLERLISATPPDVMLVYGDTTTTLAGALCAAKCGVPLAHVEAGLRSFDRTMPEEQNRVTTDHLSTLLFCPTPVAVANLHREGITEGVHMVGDVMLDAALLFADAAAHSPGPDAFGLTPGQYILVTVHRAAATDTAEALQALLEVLRVLPGPAIFPIHPRTRAKLEAAGLWDAAQRIEGVRLVPPVGYLDFTRLLTQARAVVTDSGGVQKEACLHRVPCVTLRETTEWTETVEYGFNTLAGMHPERVAHALAHAAIPEDAPSLYGDGQASVRIAELLEQFVSGRRAGA
jgi:UDP-N-acetylglucosamine 2-epimerase